MTEVARKNKEEVICAESRIDSKAVIYEPIDFSFKDMLHLSEIVDHQPRVTHKEPKTRDGKWVSQTLKLSYNALQEIEGLHDWVEQNFVSPELITSLDLSFNCLDHVPSEILKFTNLKILYLHGNKIMDIAQLDQLKQLHQLTTLAVHGNPMEKINGFRHYLLKNFPMLRQLNFGGISKADRQTAEVFMRSNKKPMKLPEQIRLDKLKKKESE